MSCIFKCINLEHLSLKFLILSYLVFFVPLWSLSNGNSLCSYLPLNHRVHILNLSFERSQSDWPIHHHSLPKQMTALESDD